jgi:hypothetical protein
VFLEWDAGSYCIRDLCRSVGPGCCTGRLVGCTSSTGDRLVAISLDMQVKHYPWRFHEFWVRRRCKDTVAWWQALGPEGVRRSPRCKCIFLCCIIRFFSTTLQQPNPICSIGRLYWSQCDKKRSYKHGRPTLLDRDFVCSPPFSAFIVCENNRGDLSETSKQHYLQLQARRHSKTNLQVVDLLLYPPHTSARRPSQQ